ncbi:DUF2125 domain-containing protein [Pseudorhodobacter sp. W20_MBD10_FR17]|uniref:DUF2125 domain-containing protein n=1 Tax=Pseudorhodobacter sp. W20_MBD10_FR17 TaxID=3240266 RepID=UPI003F979166
MSKHILITTSFAALTAFSAPVFADVTADDVWQNWKDLSTSYGQTYSTGSESRSGDTLTLTNVTVDMPNEHGKVSAIIPQIALRETGDGRVEVTMSNSYSIKSQGKNGLEKDLSSTITIDQTGLKITASGDPAAINYDIAGDAIAATMSEFMVDNKPENLNIAVNLTKLAATYAVSPAEVTSVSSTFSAQSLAFNAAGDDPENGGKFAVQGQMNNVAGASTGALPKAMATGELGEMLAQGFSTDASFTYDSGNLNLGSTDPAGTTTNVDSASHGGNLNVSLDSQRISYGGGGKGVTLKLTGTSIPFPEVTAAYDAAEFSLLIPIAKSDEPKDFALKTKLQGLTVSDMLWNMIDPGASLPRDPATLDISLKGKAKPLVDMLAVDQSAMDAPPYELSSVDIDALQLTVAGAEFKGNGALTFDNSKPPMLGGVVPMPTGKLNLSLTGANTLLGKLQALGLVDQQVTMTFGMMAGMLAKPGPTPDSFIAEVEIKEDGKILSNGNPLPF